MKKLAIIFSLFILCCTACVEQNKGATVTSEQETVKTQTIETSGKVDKLQEKNQTLQQRVETLEQKIQEIENKKQKSSKVGIWFVVIVTWLVVIVFAYFLYRLWNRCAKLKKTIIENSERGSNANVSMFENKLQQLERKVGELQEKISKSDNSKENSPKGKETNTSELQQKTIVKYLKGRSGNTFSRVVDILEDNCFYKLVNEKDGTAEFEYCGTVEDARSQFNAIFDYVCDTEGSAQFAKSVKTLKQGKVKFSDGKWEVIEKTKIKFE